MHQPTKLTPVKLRWNWSGAEIEDDKGRKIPLEQVDELKASRRKGAVIVAKTKAQGNQPSEEIREDRRRGVPRAEITRG